MPVAARRPPGSQRVEYNDSFPPATIVHYTFPARGKKLPAVKLHWYDGGLLPERPEELEPDRRLPESGTIFVGDKGKLMCETYSESPRLIPESRDAGLQAAEEDAPARPGRQRTSRTGSTAIQGKTKATSQLRLLRARSPRPCCSATWRMRFPGHEADVGRAEHEGHQRAEDANEFVQHNYRTGWSL